MSKIALLFPGQGSQYRGMGKNFYNDFKIVRDTFEEASDSLKMDMRKLCFEQNVDELTKTINAQPAILTTSVALFRAYTQKYELHSERDILCGHSLGEITALTCASAINFNDALKIVKERGRLMQESTHIGVGGMYAISGIDKNIIEKECKEYSTVENIVVVSNYNSFEQTVISGHNKALDYIADKLKSIGGKVIPLKVSAPFHSPLMQSASQKFRLELEKYTFNKLKCKVLSNLTGEYYSSDLDIIEYLTQQLVNPVRWTTCIQTIYETGIGTAIDIGPSTVLKNLTNKNKFGINVFALDNQEDINNLEKYFLINKDFDGMQPKKEFNIINKILATAVCIENKNLDDKEYEKGVVEPYEKVKLLAENLEKQGKEPSIENINYAVEMLKSILVTKKVPVNEQIEQVNKILEDTEFREIFNDFAGDSINKNCKNIIVIFIVLNF